MSLANHIDQVIDQFCTSFYDSSSTLHEAAKYVLLGKGKRVRGKLCLLAANALGSPAERAYTSALAVEMIHAYSLVHDDLPCMDDDRLRRGKPTAHVAFGEAEALLTGDALLSDAFLILSEPQFESHLGAVTLSANDRLKLVRELSFAASSQGMVAGQMNDLFWEGRNGARLDDLESVHLLKTGYLLGAAAAMGAIAGGGLSDQVLIMRKFGRQLGHCFQIVDDLLDDSARTGKSSGKDKQSDKLTYLKVMGRQDALSRAKEYTEEALSMLDPFGQQADPLRNFTRELLLRDY